MNDTPETMSVERFLIEFEGIAPLYTWGLDVTLEGRIRGRHREMILPHCPLTALYWQKSGENVIFALWPTVAQRLGLSFDGGRIIVFASDGDPRLYNQVVRSRLLAICGLTEVYEQNKYSSNNLRYRN